jgi:hypothetical protein
MQEIDIAEMQFVEGGCPLIPILILGVYAFFTGVAVGGLLR